MRWIGAAVLVLAAIGAARPGGPRAFRFEPDARDQLHRMWEASFAAKAERVACLAGEMRSDTIRVTRVLLLDGGSDSLGVSARSSLDTCAPPAWQGTVHTHVALRDGVRPYSVFSGADRGVNRMWWRRWRSDGVFCVLFSAVGAYCELDGPSGITIFPSATY
jgi:hypothetical protein